MKKYRLRWTSILTGATGHGDAIESRYMVELWVNTLNAEYKDILIHTVEEVDDTQETVTGESNG